MEMNTNLLRFKWIRSLVLSPLFPYIFQAVFLAVFVYLAVSGFGRFAPEDVSDKLYAKTNIVNLLIWGVWWPAMVWVAIWFGRVWCAVCPLELVANLTERIGRAIGLKQRVLGRWLRSGAMILALYALIQMMVSGVHLHRVPAYTSVFLWSLLTVAALTGFLFKDRAFCRGFCPVGLLLGVYGRGSMLAVRAISSQQCDRCTQKDCTSAANRYRPDARSCPSLLNPAKLDNNADCLVCGQCMKSCQPGNMGLFLRSPFHAADAREHPASWPVTLFVMLVSGFVAYELCTEWKAAKTLFLLIPTGASESLGLAAYAGWIKGVWTLFVFPALLWIVLGATVVLFRGAKTLLEAWRRLALPLVVVIAAGHMAKGLAKLNSWAGYLPLAAAEPTGAENSLAITAGTIPAPGLLLPATAISAVGIAVVLLMCYFALRESRLSDPTTHGSRIPAILTVASATIFIVFGWGF